MVIERWYSAVVNSACPGDKPPVFILGLAIQWDLREVHWGQSINVQLINFFSRFYLFIFRVRGRERERKGEKH